jgi:hypothetical protein
MKLEDIPKKNTFKVPDGYFDQLPGIIQTRTNAASKNPVFLWSIAWKFALPVALIAVVGVLWFSNITTTVEDELVTIDTSDLVAYLEQTELEHDDLMESLLWTIEDTNELEEMVFEELIPSENLDALLLEYDNEF